MIRKMGYSRQLVDELFVVVAAPDELPEVTDVVDVRTTCCVCLRVTLLGADTNMYFLSLVMVRLKPQKGSPPPRGLHL